MNKYFAILAAVWLLPVCDSTAFEIPNEDFLAVPPSGAHGLRILAPDLLQLTLVVTKPADPSPVPQWNFIGKDGQFKPPSPGEFSVNVGSTNITVDKIGFKRRPLYAPLKRRDLRLGNYLYLHLTKHIPENAVVEVKNPGGKLWGAGHRFKLKNESARWSPAIHVNQEGYTTGFVKKAMVGFFLGSLGEMDLAPGLAFHLINVTSEKAVFSGKLTGRPDEGYTYDVMPYQKVLEADFSAFNDEGEYRLQVDGLGGSFPFRIDAGMAANFARAYALGLYHQRCGGSNELPFSRFVHGPCHTKPAEVPTLGFQTVNEVLKNETGDFANNTRHTAPQLKSVAASLYPFVNKNKVNVAGGHHDAGDYSKYTINSAQLIHVLVFAADAFKGVGALDNLGLPESGDGKSDLLQVAKWEADFLAKMQDADGGFYFLVYPRDRQYEHDVLPDKGDPQVVFPKTTSATAAATAALAQAASSPLFKQQFPEAATNYLAKAKKGWSFLQKAIAQHGRDGSYQRITHYGDEFMHDDELVWAATELYCATGDKKFEKEMLEHFKPDDRETKRWTWWRLFEAYGCSIRSYAFAAKTKRLKSEQLDPQFLKLCENEIIEAGNDQLRYANQNAYGTSFPSESKRFRNAGWYFSTDRAFELATAWQMEFPEQNDPRPKFMEAIIGNINYEAGCNPVNVSYITGLGWKQPREMVHHYAQNDWRVLPPSGLAFGNIQEGFPFLDPYQKELGTLTYPSDGDAKNPTPFYDRWGDTFNTAAEFVTVNVARSLGTTAFFMAQTPLAHQKWKSAVAKISGVAETVLLQKPIKAEINIEGMNTKGAKTVWELLGQEPLIIDADKPFSFIPNNRGKYNLEAETHFPDGRRVSAAATFTVSGK